MTQGYDFGQLRYRGQQDGGLTWDKVKATAKREIAQRIRSKPDKRLFESMTPEQEAAFYAIAEAFKILTVGLGAKSMNYGAVRGGSGNDNYGAALMASYLRWHSDCVRRGLEPAIALDVIVFGLSLASSDRARRKKSGSAKKNLFNCLDVWG